MAPAAIPAQPGQIWRDDCYYLDRETGECQRKYVLVLAVDPRSGDPVTAVFTTKPHGLTTQPACSLGPPRAGYFVAVPGGAMTQASWIEFNSLQDLDRQDFERQQRTNRLQLLPQSLAPATFCGVLRCLLGFDDLTRRQARLVGDVIMIRRCP